jgi:hypothetical protein
MENEYVWVIFVYDGTNACSRLDVFTASRSFLKWAQDLPDPPHLRSLTCRTTVRSPRADFEQHLQRQIIEMTASIWFLGTNEDLRWPKVRLRRAGSNPGLRFLRNYLDLVLFRAIIDPEIAPAYPAS